MAETGDELPRKNALMRHLTRTQASFTLRRGRQVDQFIQFGSTDINQWIENRRVI